jgi:hypothetical protein
MKATPPAARPTLAALAADLAAGRTTSRKLVEDCLPVNGRVLDLHFTTLHAMRRPPAGRKRKRIIAVLCPRCHTD